MTRQLILSLFLASAYTATASGLDGLSVEVHGGYDLVNNVNHCKPGWGNSLHFNPQFGAQVEYDLNEYIGFGLDFTHANNNQWNYKNDVNSGAVFMSTSLGNALGPGRDGFFKKMNTYLNIGGGMSKANWKEVTYPEGVEDGSTMTKPFFLLGLNLEYNVTNFLAVGLNGQFRSYFTKADNEENKNFHPTTEGGNNMYLVGLGLRYKFFDADNLRNKEMSPRSYSSYNRFSLEAHGGGNVLFGQKQESTSDLNPQLGLQFEYDFSPIWGLGIDYTWAKNNQWNYKNSIQNFALFNSINIINLFNNNRGKETEDFNLYINTGIGEDYAKWSNVTEPEQEDGSGWSYPHVLAGFAFEYNVDKSISIGLNATYRYYTAEATEYAGNCFHPTLEGKNSTLSYGVGLRYKFNGSSNIRNCTRF